MAKVGYVRNDYNPLRKIRRYVQNLKISVEVYEAFDLPPLLTLKRLKYSLSITLGKIQAYRIQFCKYTVVGLSELLQNIRLRSIKLIFDARHDPHSSSNDVELFFSSISDQVILERIAFDFSAVDDQLLLEVISSLRFEDSKIVFLDLRATSSRRNDLVYLQLQETLAQIINRSSNLKELKLDNFLVDDLLAVAIHDSNSICELDFKYVHCSPKLLLKGDVEILIKKKYRFHYFVFSRPDKRVMDTTDESRYEGSVANYDYKWDVEQIESLQFSHSVFESNEEELFFPEIDNQLLCCLLRSIGPAGSLRRLECIVGKHTILKIANLLATSQTLTYLSVFFAPTKKSLKRQLFQAIKKSSTLRTLRIRDTPGRKYDDEFIEIFRCNSVLEELILVDEHVESGVTLNEYWSEILEGIRTNATSRMKSVFDECGHRERELVLVYEFKFTKRFVKLYVYSGNWQNLEFVRNAISALETNTEIDWVVLQSYSDWPDFPNL